MGDRVSGRLLGIRAVGLGDVAKRVEVAVTAMNFEAKLDELSNLDLGYAPPYASVMDAFITTVNCLRNKIDGLYRGIGPAELKARLDGGEDLFLLDVRSPAEFEATGIPGGVPVPLGALRGRMDELPRDKEIVAYCKTSLRAYEASTILEGAGFSNITVLDGGVDAWPYEKRQGPE